MPVRFVTGAMEMVGEMEPCCMVRRGYEAA